MHTFINYRAIILMIIKNFIDSLLILNEQQNIDVQNFLLLKVLNVRTF